MELSLLGVCEILLSHTASWCACWWLVKVFTFNTLVIVNLEKSPGKKIKSKILMCKRPLSIPLFSGWAFCIQNSPTMIFRDGGLRWGGENQSFPFLHPTEHPFLLTRHIHPGKMQHVWQGDTFLFLFCKAWGVSWKVIECSHCISNCALIPVLGIKPFSLSCSLGTRRAEGWRPFHPGEMTP